MTATTTAAEPTTSAANSGTVGGVTSGMYAPATTSGSIWVLGGNGTVTVAAAPTSQAGADSDLSDAHATTVDLAAADSRPVEVLRVGTFISMTGHKVTISADDLDAYVRNFEAATAGQDIPIDVQHERRDAAGWIASLYREGDRLFAVPNWNDIGKKLVGDRVFRYLSASIDVVRRTILSVSLTNFPAVKGLAPVELSEAEPIAYVSFTLEDTMSDPKNGKTIAEPNVPADDLPKTPPDATPDVPAAPTADLAAPLRDQMRELLQGEMAALREEFAAAVADMQNERKAAVTTLLAEMREERDIRDFAQDVTSTGKNALPFTADELSSLLLNLPQAHRGPVRDAFRKVSEAGTVDFSEVGTSAGKTAPAAQLDKQMAAALRDFVAAEGTVEEFFTLNKDLLGDAKQYDLSAFTNGAN